MIIGGLRRVITPWMITDGLGTSLTPHGIHGSGGRAVWGNKSGSGCSPDDCTGSSIRTGFHVSGMLGSFGINLMRSTVPGPVDIYCREMRCPVSRIRADGTVDSRVVGYRRTVRITSIFLNGFHLYNVRTICGNQSFLGGVSAPLGMMYESYLEPDNSDQQIDPSEPCCRHVRSKHYLVFAVSQSVTQANSARDCRRGSKG